MNRPLDVKSRPQLALQSYLDALLQDATDEELAPPPVPVAPPVVVEASGEVLDEFQAAVLEEQARDAQLQQHAAPAVAVAAPAPVAAPVLEAPAPMPSTLSPVVPMLQALVPPVVEVHLPPSNPPPPVAGSDRPSWAAEPFECLLFDVAGLTLAVPLVCLGSIYSLAGLVGHGQGMRHTEVLGILAELWRATGQEASIPELVADYLRRDLLNRILGNTDNHGRTLSVLRTDAGVRLAPIHDLAPKVMDDEGIARTTKWPGRMEVAGDVDWRLVCASLKPLLDPEAALMRLRADAEQLRALPDLLSAGGLPEATLNHPRIHLRHLDRRLQEWGLR